MRRVGFRLSPIAALRAFQRPAKHGVGIARAFHAGEVLVPARVSHRFQKAETVRSDENLKPLRGR
jgi:hypothetical protein